MSRVDFLRKKWADRVAAAARERDHSLPRDAVAFDVLLGADPTPRCVYAEFVMRTYCNGEFLAEDAERLRETLVLFHRSKKRLPPERRDIGRYSGERELWECLTAAGITAGAGTSGKMEKRSERNRAHLESEVVTSGGWTMATPQSAFAARWWGMGTRWCTTNGNTFEHYRARGRLHVFVCPEGVKHQIHVGTASLCDAADAPVAFGPYLSRLPGEFLDRLRSDVSDYFVAWDLRNIDDHSFQPLHRALERLPVALFGGEMKDALDRLKTFGLSRLVRQAEEDGWTVWFAKSFIGKWALLLDLDGKGSPQESHTVQAVETPDGNRHLVEMTGQSLRDAVPLVQAMPIAVREALLTRCLKSLKSNGPALGGIAELVGSVRPGDLSPVFWLHWAKKVGGYERDMIAIGSSRGTRAGVFAPYRPEGPDPGSLVIPEAAMTVEIARVFAKQGLRHRIPDHLLTAPVARDLARASIDYLNDPGVGDILDDDDLAAVYGMGQGARIAEMPAAHRTAEMARRIVSGHIGTFKALLGEIRNGSFDLGATDPGEFELELARLAISFHAASLSAVDFPLPRDVYLDAVRRDPGLLGRVPLPFRDRDMCLAALEAGSHALCHFPEWVVRELRDADGGRHGVTEGYKASQKYAAVLRECGPPGDGVPDLLAPFKVPVPPASRHGR